MATIVERPYQSDEAERAVSVSFHRQIQYLAIYASVKRARCGNGFNYVAIIRFVLFPSEAF